MWVEWWPTGRWSGWDDVGEVAVSQVCGDGRLESGGHGHVGDQGQHGLGGIVGQHSAVAGGEPVNRRGSDYVGQHVGEQFGGYRVAVFFGVAAGPGGRNYGSDLLADVLGRA